jgi:hypothetical protein
MTTEKELRERERLIAEKLQQLQGDAPRSWAIVASYVVMAIVLLIALFIVASFT